MMLKKEREVAYLMENYLDNIRDYMAREVAEDFIDIRNELMIILAAKRFA